MLNKKMVFVKTIRLLTLFLVLVAAERRRYAVSPLNDETKQFYLKIKTSRTPLQPSENETLKVKLDICADITGSPLFTSVYHLETANPLEMELVRYYPLFRNFLSPTTDYRRLEIDVDGEFFDEHGFSCLARSRYQKLEKARDLKEYFVSGEYRLNEQNESQMYRAERDVFGRFVFAYEKKKLGVLTALAEEPGRTLRLEVAMSSNADWKERKANSEVDEHDKTDTICELSIFQKIRLCNIILSAKKYSKKVQFVPCESNVDPQCVRKDIELEGAKDQDWMVGCKAAKLKNNETVTYYVSRGFSGHNYYICSAYEPGDKHRCVAGVTHRIAAKPFLHEDTFLRNTTLSGSD